MAARPQIQPEPEADPLIERFVGYNLKRAYMILQADFRRALGEGGLSPRMFSALALAVDYPGISQADVARRLGIERSGLVAIFDALEARGLVARVPVPGDRRVQAICPTEAGEQALAQAVDVIQAEERRRLADLSEEEQATLLHLLQRVRATGEDGRE